MKMPRKRPTASQVRKAVALATSVKRALEAGTIHRDRSGKILTTPLEIIDCLVREGKVLCEEPVKA